MANPLYLFFSSRAGVAGTVLRWTLAAFLLHFACWQILHLLGQPTMGEALLIPWLPTGPEAAWLNALGIFILGVGFLLGLFTRICALVLLGFILTEFWHLSQPTGAELREILFASAMCLTLMIAGAGRCSVDRRVSEFFLPTFY